MNNQYLQHHGVKGMKWGVRRYQYIDGSLTPAGKKRYQNSSKSSMAVMKTKELINQGRTKATGKQYVDGYLKQGTSFKRIQSYDNFERFAFYATYKKEDNDKYLGLFGKNLIDRASYEAKSAEKKAQQTGNELDIVNAKTLRDKANNMKVYQLSIEATKKLKIPSDTNAGDITANLLKESKFKSDVEASIKDSKDKMRRPSQQILFKQAQNALSKDVEKLSSSDKIAIYKALNLSLTNHNAQEIAAQNRFYSELKKKGYNALLDYNDKQYSSYHAKRPIIVFDLDSVKLASVAETNPKVVNALNKKYNRERITKEISAQTIGLIKIQSTKTVAECYSYLNQRTEDYLRR